MIPIRDVVPTRTRPWATLALIGANAAAALYVGSLSADDAASLRYRFGVLPVQLEWTTLLTSLFIHTNALHAGVNLVVLWLFGSTMEDRLGAARFLVLYAAGGLAGAAVSVWAMPLLDSPLVGATAAVGAVVGAYIWVFPKSRVLVLVPVPLFLDAVELPALFFAGVWLATELLVSAGSIVDPSAAGGLAFWTIAAGIATGVVGLLLLQRPERARPDWWAA